MKIQGYGYMQSLLNKPIVIHGGNGNNKIHVTENKNGGVDVTVTNLFGQSRCYSLTAEEAERLVIRAGGGNDLIKVDSGVKQKITVHGSRGKDMFFNGPQDEFVPDRKSKDRPERPGSHERGRDDTTPDA
jgi:hypothetical protein